MNKEVQAQTVEELLLKVRMDVGFDTLLSTIVDENSFNFTPVKKPGVRLENSLLSKMVANETSVSLVKATKWTTTDGVTFRHVGEKRLTKQELDEAFARLLGAVVPKPRTPRKSRKVKV
jgi:hypothetical protein